MELTAGARGEYGLTVENIGSAYYQMKQYNAAHEHYLQAMDLAQKTMQGINLTPYLNNLAALHSTWGKYDTALEYFQQTLALARQSGEKASIATYLDNIGGVYQAQKQYAQAREYFIQALEVARTLEQQPNIARYLNNIGASYLAQEKYSEAIQAFEESVALKEQMRKTAKDELRLDYLAEQIHTYQFLIACYLRMGDIANAFRINELSRAKLLQERLRRSDTDMAIPSLSQIQAQLPEDTAVLIYATTPDHHLGHITITKDQLAGREFSLRETLQHIQQSRVSETLAQSDSDTRGLGLRPTAETSPEEVRDLTSLVSNYRILLSMATTDETKAGQGKDRDMITSQSQFGFTAESEIALGKQLYHLLFEHSQKLLTNKTRLNAVPDGILNFLPFETLIDEQGSYLVEKYHITYAQSLSVLALIQQRRYPQQRKPLLAFGGAVMMQPIIRRRWLKMRPKGRIYKNRWN